MKSISRPVTIVGLSGWGATGTSSAAKGVANKLGWKFRSSGDTVRQMAAARGMSDMRVDLFAASVSGLDEQIEAENKEFVRAHRDGCVLDARLAVEAMEGLEGICNILLHCPDEIRFEREAQRKQISLEAAREGLMARDAADAKRYENLYGILDISDLSRYHLLINTGEMGVAETANVILEAIGRL